MKLVPGRASERRRKRYGITDAQLGALLAEQAGVCALCRERVPTDIDHDHETGQVRGFLCRGCNLGLGMFWENIDLLRRAIEYLSQPPSGIAATITKPGTKACGQRGDAHHMAKLNASHISAIRAEYAAGVISYAELGKKYRVHAGTIGKIVRGDRWRAGGA